MLKHLFCTDKAVLTDFQKDAGWIAVCSWVEGLCSMIQIVSNRLDDYSSLFEISKYELSNIFNTSLDYDILLFKSFRYTEQTLVVTQAAPTRSLQALFKKKLLGSYRWNCASCTYSTNGLHWWQTGSWPKILKHHGHKWNFYILFFSVNGNTSKCLNSIVKWIFQVKYRVCRHMYPVMKKVRTN